MDHVVRTIDGSALTTTKVAAALRLAPPVDADGLTAGVAIYAIRPNLFLVQSREQQLVAGSAKQEWTHDEARGNKSLSTVGVV